MGPEAFRRLALALPEAREEPHRERSSFRVGQRIFATLTADGAEAMVKVPDPDAVEALLAERSGTFFTYGAWTARLGALGVRLAQAKEPRMRELLLEAWRSVAPKRLSASRDAPVPRPKRRRR